jgi:hypothetical protein
MVGFSSFADFSLFVHIFLVLNTSRCLKPYSYRYNPFKIKLKEKCTPGILISPGSTLGFKKSWGTPMRSVPMHCKENYTFVFLFWELRGLSPNFHIYVFLSDLYIPRICPHISCSRIDRLIFEIYKSLIDI